MVDFAAKEVKQFYLLQCNSARNNVVQRGVLVLGIHHPCIHLRPLFNKISFYIFLSPFQLWPPSFTSLVMLCTCSSSSEASEIISSDWQICSFVSRDTFKTDYKIKLHVKTDFWASFFSRSDSSLPIFPSFPSRPLLFSLTRGSPWPC